MRFRSTNMVDIFNEVTGYMFFNWKRYGTSPNGFGLITPLEFIDHPIDIGRISTTYDDVLCPSRGCNNCHHVKFHCDHSYGIEEAEPYPNGNVYSSTHKVSRHYTYTRECTINDNDFVLRDTCVYNLYDPEARPPRIPGAVQSVSTAQGTRTGDNSWSVRYHYYEDTGKTLEKYGTATLSKSTDYTVYFLPDSYQELFTPGVSKWVTKCNQESSLISFRNNVESELVLNSLENGREMINNYENLGSLFGMASTLGSTISVENDIVSALRKLSRGTGNLAKLLNMGAAPGWVYVALKTVMTVWMGYRYVYNTTKMDAMATLDTMNHLLTTNLLDIPFHTYRSGGDFLSGHWNFSFRLSPRNYHSYYKSANDLGLYLDKFYLALGTLGLDPSLANFWDCVPLSFVVDWFLPLGDYLQDMASCKVFDHAKVTDACYSYKNHMTMQYRNSTIYVTFYRRKYIELSQGVYHSDDKTSTKTIIKRVLDGICLFF